MADHQEASVTLPTEPVSVRAARRYAEAVLAEWGVPVGVEAGDAVQLIVSELTANVVQHTSDRSPTFTVHLHLDRSEQIRVGVTDSCPALPRRLPAAVQRDNGRGLVIVRHLATEAGGRMSVTPSPDGGKTVWVFLPWAMAAASASASASPAC